MSKHLFITVIAAFLLISVNAYSFQKKSFIPENNLWISKEDKSNHLMNEELFNSIINKVVTVYEPIVSQNGGKLIIKGDWNDGTVNAYASRRFGRWNVNMFGGLARHKVVTPDAFALVICHELGHHLGGIPKMPGLFTSWATNEGQSDYYATLKCMRKVFYSDDNESIMLKIEVPQIVVDECSKQFQNINEKYLCQRSAMAGYSLASLLKELSDDSQAPSFTTKDPNIVDETKNMHPATQCRLDTYFAGALCGISDTQDVSYKDEAKGVCYRAHGDQIGVRPLCWFKPRK